MSWQTVVGLEVHARLLTKTKIFCRCSTAFGADANTQVCPVCLAYPGALPVLNRQAVHLAMRAAFALGCTVHNESVFARKNYFYPDLPKGYQISQFDQPLATNGRLEIPTADGGRKVVRILRIHMEEDAGKSMHQFPFDDVKGDVSLVDLNRAGVPLIEIVSEPDIATPEEATAYLTRLRQILMYTDVCDGNMEEGSLRCDANVSVRREGEPLGTRAEVKNLNSFRFLARAIEFESQRQSAAIGRGEKIVQETRLFDVNSGETRSMRSKEDAHDYRYFADPDLLPLRVSDDWKELVRGEIPALPHERVERYVNDFGIPAADAEVLVTTRDLAEYYEAVVLLSGDVKLSTNWIRNEVLGILKETKQELADFRVKPTMLAEMIRMITSGAISGKMAKEIFEEMTASGEAPAAIAEKRGMTQITDRSVIRAAAEKVIAANPTQVEQYRAGKQALFGFLVGQVMKETRGKAKPELANEILRQLL